MILPRHSIEKGSRDAADGYSTGGRTEPSHVAVCSTPKFRLRRKAMSPTQTHEVLSLIGTLWPNLRLDEKTRHAWAMVLKRLDYHDTVEAVTELATEKTRIQIAHIGQRAERVKRERLANVSELDLVIPPEIADDGA